MTHPFININDHGVALLSAAPIELTPCGPITVSVHHDRTIELHGTGFSASTRLDRETALALIAKLAFILREPVPATEGAAR